MPAKRGKCVDHLTRNGGSYRLRDEGLDVRIGA
jgi:hypothetical protein